MAGFANKCPQCRTAVKIRSRDMDGKKARCPKCSTVFRIKAPPSAKAKSAAKPESEEFSFLDKITDADLADHGSPDGSSDELNEFDDESLEAHSSGLGNKSKKKRKDKQPINSDLMIGGVVVGVGLLLFAALGTFGVKVLPKLLEQRSRVAYMPHDIETLLEINPEELWTSSALRPLRETEFGAGLRVNLDKLLHPLKIDELDYIAVGFPLSSSKNPYPVIVFYALSTFDVPTLKSQSKGFTELTHREQTYYLNETDQRAAFFPEPDMLVYGTEAHIQAAIENQGFCGAERLFDLPFRKTIVFVSNNGSGSNNLDMTALVGPGIVPRVEAKGLQGISMAIDVGRSFAMQVGLKYEDPEMVEQLVTTTSEKIPETIERLISERDDRNKTDPEFQMNVTGEKGFMTGQIEMMESFEIWQDESNVKVAFVFPSALIDRTIGTLAMYGASLFPGANLIPEIDEEIDVGNDVVEGLP